MKVLTEIKEHYTSKNPVVLTLGFFDGVHLGHQKLFKKVREIKGSQGISYAFTFSNHPQTVLRPETPFPLITTLQHRVKLIEKEEINSLFLLPFTEEIKEMNADDFLLALMESLAFTDLVLGPDATIGKDREGSLELLKLLSKKFSFNLHQVEPYFEGKEKVSSTIIRQKIAAGDLQEAQKLLGRPYSIIADLTDGIQKGTEIGFPTLNFNVDGLVTPPLGVYKVKLNGKLGVANFGLAPTVQMRKDPVLEVHVLNTSDVNPNDSFEIEFSKFIRPEKKFHSLDELKMQIKKDIETVKS